MYIHIYTHRMASTNIYSCPGLKFFIINTVFTSNKSIKKLPAIEQIKCLADCQISLPPNRQMIDRHSTLQGLLDQLATG